MTSRPTSAQLSAALLQLANAIIEGHDTNATHELARHALKLAHRYEQEPDPADLTPAAGGTDTSAAMALRYSDTLRGLCARVMKLFKEHPDADLGYTNSELIKLMPNENPRSVQPRTSQLQRAGLLMPSGYRRRNHRGHDEIVWMLTPRGLQWRAKE